MPIPFSTCHGGMTPDLVPREVRDFIAFAQGRASSYVMSGIGPVESGR